MLYSKLVSIFRLYEKIFVCSLKFKAEHLFQHKYSTFEVQDHRWPTYDYASLHLLILEVENSNRAPYAFGIA